jgi:hypothetical protein
MSKIFALLAVGLILSGALLLAVPREGDPASARSLSVNPSAVPPIVNRARDIAEQINAPLSILFGLVSLYYSRRSYHVNKARAEADKARAA